MSLIVPKQFSLGGIEVVVVEDKDLVSRKKCIGEAQYAEQKILIDHSVTPDDSINQAFYHELTHWILYMMSEHDLRQNEKFVDTFAHFLYQFEKTKVM